MPCNSDTLLDLCAHASTNELCFLPLVLLPVHANMNKWQLLPCFPPCHPHGFATNLCEQAVILVSEVGRLVSGHLFSLYQRVKCLNSSWLQHLVVANGGLGNNVSRNDLERIFAPCGEIVDILMKPRKPYAFISFTEAVGAERAMQTLQGAEVTGSDLSLTSLRFYLSFITSGEGLVSFVILWSVSFSNSAWLCLFIVPGLEAASLSLPPGLVLIPDFINKDKEEELLECIDWEYSDPNLKEGQSWFLITACSMLLCYKAAHSRL